MKKSKRNITLDEAADKLATLTQDYLDELPPKERERRLKAFKAVADEAAASSSVGSAGIPARSSGTPGIQGSRIAVRERR